MRHDTLTNEFIAHATPQQLAAVSGVTEQRYAATLERIRNGAVRKDRLVPRQNEYTRRISLYPKQKAFALLPQRDAMAHGAGGTGKTELLIYEALKYVDLPYYSVLVLRRTFKQLNLSNSILDRFRRILKGAPYRWNAQDMRAEFPSGARVTFGYLETETDKYRYDSAEFQTIIVDEAIQFPQSSLEFLYARLRRLKAHQHHPLRFRLATNPGGLAHLYLRNRFLEQYHEDRAHIPFYMEDNPALDTEAYIKSLTNLDAVMYAQRRFGDWYASRTDVVMPRDWVQLADMPFTGGVTRVRFWDLAATEPKQGKDPDYTVGTLMARDQFGKFRVEDVQRFRAGPAQVEERVYRTAKADGRNVYVRMEEEGGASGKSLVAHYVRLLAGWNVAGVRPGGPKLARWSPLAGQARAGNLSVVTGPWASDWLDECCNLTGTEGDAVHDDQFDSAAGAFRFFVEEMPIGRVGVLKL
jgi:predicted phage terminase large subunit-like protein